MPNLIGTKLGDTPVKQGQMLNITENLLKNSGQLFFPPKTSLSSYQNCYHSGFILRGKDPSQGFLFFIPKRTEEELTTLKDKFCNCKDDGTKEELIQKLVKEINSSSNFGNHVSGESSQEVSDGEKSNLPSPTQKTFCNENSNREGESRNRPTRGLNKEIEDIDRDIEGLEETQKRLESALSSCDDYKEITFYKNKIDDVKKEIEAKKKARQKLNQYLEEFEPLPVPA